MIEEFVRLYHEHEMELAAVLGTEAPSCYQDIVTAVVKWVLRHSEGWERPDPERIHLIDDGDYQGTLVFVIGAHGYQPSKYWAVKVGYGSCSGCDTLEAIRFEDDPEVRRKDLMTLALHIVQGLKEI